MEKDEYLKKEKGWIYGWNGNGGERKVWVPWSQLELQFVIMQVFLGFGGIGEVMAMRKEFWTQNNSNYGPHYSVKLKILWAPHVTQNDIVKGNWNGPIWLIKVGIFFTTIPRVLNLFTEYLWCFQYLQDIPKFYINNHNNLND